MGTLSYFIKTIWQLRLPIIKNTVFFSSYKGQYNDNPKYISEYLHSNNPEINIVWAIGASSREIVPDYIKTVRYRSSEYCKYIARAQVVVDNYIGCRHVITKTANPIKKLLFKLYSRKRKNQLNISTWHGTPLKHISLDEPKYINNKNSRAYTSTDVVLAGCSLTSNTFITAFKWKGITCMFGTPRNDILFTEVDKQVLRDKLSLPKDKKIILYAPTFRNNINDSGVAQMRALNFEKLFEALQKKFGGEWCLAIRVHQEVLLKIAIDELANQYGGRVINGNIGDDMAEYLACSDILCTDYSSSMFDFALTGKPCFLFVHDIEHYEREERGFYMDFNSLPFPSAQTSEELVTIIDNFDAQAYKENVNKFLNKVGNCEDGHASERVVEEIINFLKAGIKR